MKDILILDGHPDPSDARLVHALAEAYRQGAEQAGHQVKVVRLADLTFPLLRSQADYEKSEPVDSVRNCQHLMEWATHTVIFYPLWLGSMPAFLYRWYFRAHSLRSLQRNILRFVGFRRVRSTIIGSAGSMTRAQREAWLQNLRDLGQAAA